MNHFEKALQEAILAAKEACSVKITIDKKRNDEDVSVTVRTDLPDEIGEVRDAIVTSMIVETLCRMAIQQFDGSVNLSNVSKIVDEFVDITAERMRIDITEALVEQIMNEDEDEEEDDDETD